MTRHDKTRQAEKPFQTFTHVNCDFSVHLKIYDNLNPDYRYAKGLEFAIRELQAIRRDAIKATSRRARVKLAIARAVLQIGTRRKRNG